eukprot:TRINITY_DN9663_c0_g1_i4.p1 TRINITY_DN9663_c0_g1~~TRINITY_DN9663_c0_g1_i4.p1  ORF type:complete len:237 (-),score=19.92 TRINITY_DN9663_c0_g1_i4:41-751(-)
MIKRGYLITDKMRNKSDMKYLKEAKNTEFMIMGDKGKYMHRVNYEGTDYVFKQFKTCLGDLEDVCGVYQEYFFLKASSCFYSYFSKPLYIDYAIELTETQKSNVNIDILFEDGITLDKLKPMTVEVHYALMLQSAIALLFFCNIGIAPFKIKPFTILYDPKANTLKIADMGNIPLEVLKGEENLDMQATSAYNWAIYWLSLICNKSDLEDKTILELSLIHICRCRRIERCRSRWSP